MKTEDDDFPYTSDDPSLAPAENESHLARRHVASQQATDLKATLRVVIGSVLNAQDAYTQRLRRLHSMQQEATAPEVITLDPDESLGAQFKYLLLGALFEIPDLLDRGVSTAGNTSSKIYGLVSKVTSPLTNSWIFRPVKGSYEHAAGRGEETVNRLMMRGRREELNSRRMVQQKAFDDLVNEIMEHVLTNTDVQELIEDQGIGVANGMLDEYRDQSAAVDNLLERRVRMIFRRGAPSHPSTPPGNSEHGE